MLVKSSSEKKGVGDKKLTLNSLKKKNHNLRTIIDVKIKGLTVTRGSRMYLKLLGKLYLQIIISFWCLEASCFCLYFQCLSLFSLTQSWLNEESLIPRTYLKKKKNQWQLLNIVDAWSGYSNETNQKLAENLKTEIWRMRNKRQRLVECMKTPWFNNMLSKKDII